MSSSPGGDADAPPKSHSQSEQPQNTVQATEQQLKARAEGVSIEDYLLPRSITVRLAKSVLPPNTSVQKDAVLAIQKAATVFVSYLSSQYVPTHPLFPYLFPFLSYLFGVGLVSCFTTPPRRARLKLLSQPANICILIEQRQRSNFKTNRDAS